LNSSRVKGFNYEREVVNRSKDEGLPARRMWGSDGRSAGYSKDTDLIIAGQKFQAKRKKTAPKWTRITKDIDGVVFREDNGVSRVIIGLNEYLVLLKRSVT